MILLYLLIPCIWGQPSGRVSIRQRVFVRGERVLYKVKSLTGRFLDKRHVFDRAGIRKRASVKSFTVNVSKSCESWKCFTFLRLKM